MVSLIEQITSRHFPNTAGP